MHLRQRIPDVLPVAVACTVLTASELEKHRNGGHVKTDGLAIVKQRPGTPFPRPAFVNYPSPQQTSSSPDTGGPAKPL